MDHSAPDSQPPVGAAAPSGAVLAAVSLPGKGETDRFLADLVADLAAAGLRLAGTVQTNPLQQGRARCDMDLRVLPDGPVLRISEERGELARGCRLDTDALEQAVVEVAGRLDGADLLVLNKFGKHEAEGRGLVTVIAAALERGLPVLVGVNGLNLPALRAFAGDFLVELPPDRRAVRAWALGQGAGPGRAP